MGGYEHMLTELQHKLIALTNPEDATFLQRFFKTGPGQYGEGDLFRGIRVPVLRRLSKEYLQIHYRQMPRTMLRYAIEKHPQEKRLAYLK